VFDCGEYAAIAPAAPTGLTVTPGGAQAALAWTAPTNTGGVALTDYRIQYSFNSGSFTTFSRAASTATSATVTGLAAGTYVFRVAAVNSAGTGADVTSSSSSVTAGGSPTLSISRDNGSSTFTAVSASSYTRALGTALDAADGVSHYSWTVSGSGTVTITLDYNDDAESGNTARLFKATVQQGANISSADSVTRTFSVTSGNIITIGALTSADAAPPAGSQYFANVSISVA